MEEERIITTSLRPDGIVLIVINGQTSKGNYALLSKDIVDSNAFITAQSIRLKRKLCTIVDLSSFNRIYTPEEMRLLAEYERMNEPYVQRTACFGADMKTRLVAETVAAFSNRKNISYYDTEEEALASLNLGEQQPPA